MTGKRSDTFAAQIAALDMVLTAIEEGRDPRSFISGMMRAIVEQRNAALEAEAYDLPGANDPAGGIDNGPCADFAPDTLGDDPGVCTTCFYQGIDHRVAAIEHGNNPAKDRALWPTNGIGHDPIPDAISVRAAIAFGDWKGKP